MKSGSDVPETVPNDPAKVATREAETSVDGTERTSVGTHQRRPSRLAGLQRLPPPRLQSYRPLPPMCSAVSTHGCAAASGTSQGPLEISKNTDGRSSLFSGVNGAAPRKRTIDCLSPLPRSSLELQPKRPHSSQSFNDDFKSMVHVSHDLHQEQAIRPVVETDAGPHNRPSDVPEKLPLHSKSFKARSRRSRKEERQAVLNMVWPDPRKYNARSLMLFTLDNRARRAAIASIEWRWWDRGVLVLIFLNTVQLALFDPFDIPALQPHSPQRDAMRTVGVVFSALFLVECLVKIFALGFIVGPSTYLKDAWNYLDFAVVIIGVLDFFPADVSSGSNLSALRSLRVMRPLRLVNQFPELQHTVKIMLSCLPDLSNAVFLVLFILLVFGILGVQLFNGVLRGSCFHVDTGEARDSPEHCGYLPCGPSAACLQLGRNPSRGIVTFDHIGASMMTVFQVRHHA